LDKPSFEESLRELAARRLAAEAHPTPEDLAAYGAGELAMEQHERIKDHLAICESCSRLFLDLAEFERFEPAQSISPADAQAEVSWQRLRERLKEDGGEADVERQEEPRAEEPAPVLAPHPSRRRVPVWQRPAIPWALAAGLALFVLGLGMRVGSLREEVERLSEPQAAPVVTLLSEDDTTRGERDARLSVRTGDFVAYDLPLSSDPDAPAYPLYSVKVISASGSAKPVQVRPQPAEDGLLRIFLPSAPEPGDYYFEVAGIEGEKETPVGRYPFTILPAR